MSVEWVHFVLSSSLCFIVFCSIILLFTDWTHWNHLSWYNTCAHFLLLLWYWFMQVKSILYLIVWLLGADRSPYDDVMAFGNMHCKYERLSRVLKNKAYKTVFHRPSDHEAGVQFDWQGSGDVFNVPIYLASVDYRKTFNSLAVWQQQRLEADSIWDRLLLEGTMNNLLHQTTHQAVMSDMGVD